MADFGQNDEVVSKPSTVTSAAKSSWGQDDEVVSKPADTKQPIVGGRVHNIVRSAVEAAPSAAAGLAGFGAGMAAAAPVAASVAPFTGPFAPVTAAAIEFGGGLGTAFVASGAAQKLTDMMHKTFAPEDYAQRQIEKQQRPYGTFAAQTLANLAGMSPKTAPEVAGKILTNPAVQRGVSGTLMGGIEAGSELASEGKVDPLKVAASVATGAAMPGFNPAGKKLFEAGQSATTKIRSSLHSTADEKPLAPEAPSKVNSTPEEQKAFLDTLKANKAKKDAQAKVVQAAFKNNETGEIELHGPKHDENRKAETTDTHTQGFVDENGNFLDRKEAWNRAADLGQVEQTKPSQKDGLHTTDLRESGDKNFELFHTPETVEGVPVVIDRGMTRSTDGGVVGARFKHETNEIGFNPEHTYQQFLDKAWTKPQVDGVFPISKDAFKTPQEWADFVLQHEAEHVKTPQLEGQTKAQYENQTNKAALKAIAEKKAKATGEPATEFRAATLDDTVAPKTIYHGTSSQNVQIDSAGNLILRPSSNFGGKTNSVSFSHDSRVSDRYAGDSVTKLSDELIDDPEALDKLKPVSIEISSDAVQNLSRENKEEWAVNTTEPVVIPKGKYKVVEIDPARLKKSNAEYYSGKMEEPIIEWNKSTTAPKPTEPAAETKPAEPVVDRTKTDPRDVKSQQEFNEIAQEIYEKHGDTKAIEFFEGYKEYVKTWLEPIAETEKYTGINLRNKAANERVTSNNTKDLLDTAGKDVDLNKLTYDIDKGVTLTGKAKQVADKFRALMDELGKRALDAGVIKGWHEDYVARNVVSEGDAPPTALQELIQDLFGTGGKGDGSKTTTKYGKERVLKTREDLVDHLNKMNAWLEEKGENYRFKLKTDNLAEIYHDYASSVEKAIENKKLVETLMQIRNPAGEALIREVNKDNPIPYNWKTIDSAQFAGMAVHPDMAPALKFVFDAPPGKLMEALGSISQWTKRFNVVGSFFHAKSMMEVMSSAGIPIWTPVKEALVLPAVEKVVKGVTGKDIQLSAISKAVDQYRKGGVGDNVDKWIRDSGLVLEVPEDVTKGFLTSLGKFSDSMIGKFGPKTRVLEKSLSTVEKYTLGMFDKFTWDYLHTGGKIMLADAYLDKARISAAKEGKPFDEAQQRKEIASFLNNSFGGLNWFEAATQTQNEFAKRIAMAAYSPEGRRGLQVALFAPDWTISTLRAFTSALPKELNPTKWQPVEGIKGMVTPTTKADYARLYQFKTALTYLTVLNIANMITANRPIWENKDPTRIEWPDGTSMQAMKHAMEPYHWIADPDKTLASKLGFVPKALWVGLAGTEYASPQAQKLIAPSVTGNTKIDEALARGSTIVKSILPFQAQAAMDSPKGEGTKRALLGTAGFPVYGKTPEQRKIDKEDRKLRSEQNAWDYHEAEINAGREKRTAAHIKEGKRIQRENTNLAKKKARLE